VIRYTLITVAFILVLTGVVALLASTHYLTLTTGSYKTSISSILNSPIILHTGGRVYFVYEPQPLMAGRARLPLAAAEARLMLRLGMDPGLAGIVSGCRMLLFTVDRLQRFTDRALQLVNSNGTASAKIVIGPVSVGAGNVVTLRYLRVIASGPLAGEMLEALKHYSIASVEAGGSYTFPKSRAGKLVAVLVASLPDSLVVNASLVKRFTGPGGVTVYAVVPGRNSTTLGRLVDEMAEKTAEGAIVEEAGLEQAVGALLQRRGLTPYREGCSMVLAYRITPSRSQWLRIAAAFLAGAAILYYDYQRDPEPYRLLARRLAPRRRRGGG